MLFFIFSNQLGNLSLVLFAFWVVDGEDAHEDIGWVVELAHFVAHALEIISALSREALVHDVAVAHQYNAVKEGESLRRGLVDGRTDRLTLFSRQLFQELANPHSSEAVKS